MKDISLIPKGDYCYTWIEVPGIKNNFHGKVKYCPYSERKEIDGVVIPWCGYLELGGTPGCGKWKGWENYEEAEQKLINHFGSQEEMDKKLPLFLLFDDCKECEINYGEEEP